MDELSNRDDKILHTLSVPIPKNEQKRLKILREMNLIGSDPNDPNFDRFTSMLIRIFKIEYAFINFVDIEIVYTKSKSGKYDITFDRNNAFCSYVLIEQSDILVVRDLSTDERFQSNPFVSDLSYNDTDNNDKFRFYAGVALTVHGMKIGTLGMLDSKPRKAFSFDERMNLLDLGVALSAILSEQYDLSHSCLNEKSFILVDVVKDFDKSIEKLTNFIDKLLTDIKESKTKLNDSYLTELSRLLTSLNITSEQINLMIKSSINICNILISNNKLSDHTYLLDDLSTAHIPSIIFHLRETNVLKHVIKLRDLFTNVTSLIAWNINKSDFDNVNLYTYKDIINYLLLSVLNDLIIKFQSITVNVTYKNSPVETDNSFYFKTIYKYSHHNNNYNISNGSLSISIAISNPIELNTPLSTSYTSTQTNSSNTWSRNNELGNQLATQVDKSLINHINKQMKSLTKSSNLSSYTIQNILIDFGGASSIQSNNTTNSHTLLFDIPCYKLKTLNSNSLDTENNNKTMKKNNNIVNLNTLSLDEIDRYTHAIDNTDDFFIEAYDEEEVDTTYLQVLVIEDSIMHQKLINHWMVSNKCHVTYAANGKIGFEFLKTKKFDFVLIDFLMPVQNGITTIEQFHEWSSNNPSNHNQNILIIGMSSNYNIMEQEQGFNHGMHFFLLKPLDSNILILILKIVLKYRFNPSIDKNSTGYIESLVHEIKDEAMIYKASLQHQHIIDNKNIIETINHFSNVPTNNIDNHTISVTNISNTKKSNSPTSLEDRIFDGLIDLKINELSTTTSSLLISDVRTLHPQAKIHEPNTNPIFRLFFRKSNKKIHPV